MTTTIVQKNQGGPAATFAAGPDDVNVSEVINPATGEVVAGYRRATQEDVNAAVKRAEEAFKVWGSTTPIERAEVSDRRHHPVRQG